jgi:hypothetical protein
VNAPLPLAVGMVARLRKAHPCGGYEWQVTRVGADIGLRCTTCGRKILIPREELERRVQRLTTPGSPEEARADAAS